MALNHNDNHTEDVGPAFVWAVVLNTVYVLVDALFDFWVGSRALLADAAHSLTDVFGF